MTRHIEFRSVILIENSPDILNHFLPHSYCPTFSPVILYVLQIPIIINTLLFFYCFVKSIHNNFSSDLTI